MLQYEPMTFCRGLLSHLVVVLSYSSSRLQTAELNIAPKHNSHPQTRVRARYIAGYHPFLPPSSPSSPRFAILLQSSPFPRVPPSSLLLYPHRYAFAFALGRPVASSVRSCFHLNDQHSPRDKPKAAMMAERRPMKIRRRLKSYYHDERVEDRSGKAKAAV